MHSTLSKRTLAIGGAAVAVLAVVIGGLLLAIPPVVGLGNKVKLPLLHGGSTWVNLLIFAFMGICGVAYLVNRNDRVYAWEAGLRWVAAPLWLVNSTLGFIAATTTWHFYGSNSYVWAILTADPRLRVQFMLLFAVAVIVLLDWLVLERRVYKAIADIVFSALMIGLMSDLFLDPVKRSLHPDSPVLNSGWEIKAPFFGMVVAILVITLVLSWLAASTVHPAPIAAETQENFCE